LQSHVFARSFSLSYCCRLNFRGAKRLTKFISLVNEKNDAVVIIVVIALRSSAIENYILIIGEYSTCII